MSILGSVRQGIVPMLAMSLLLAACAPATEARIEDTPAGEAMADKSTPTTDTMMDEGTPTPDAMTGKETPMAEAMDEAVGMSMPGFFSISLTDVATGTAFTLADLQGKVVLLEPFAQWCPTCLSQQREVSRLHELLGERDDFVSVGLDIDPNEDAIMLQGYLSRNGFDWLYAIAPAEVGREIGERYGSQYLNPPSAPMFAIDRHGEVHPLPFGKKSAEDLLKIFEPFLAEAM